MPTKRCHEPALPSSVSIFEGIHSDTTALGQTDGNSSCLSITRILKANKEALPTTILPCRRVLPE